MRILVTGCGGYIGTTLSPYLLRRGYRIRCIDWLVFGEDVVSHLTSEKGFELVRMDVRLIDSSLLEGVDAVVDLAAIPNDPTGDLLPSLTDEINHRARARLAYLSKKHGVPLYILASSTSIYGRQISIVDEESKPNPLTIYARANLAAEQSILPMADKRFSPVALRFSTVYGPSRRMRFDLVVNAMTLSAYMEGRIYVEGDGNQERPLIHVLDVARAVGHIIERSPEEISGRVFNVGSDDQNYRVRDIANIVKSIVGGEIMFRGEIDRRSYRVSFERIRRLGFQTLYRVEDGVKQIYHELLTGIIRPEDRWFTVRWYRKLLDEGRVKK